MSAVREQKATLRRALVAARAARSGTDRDRAGERLTAALLPWLRDAERIAVYVSFGTEPPTAALVAALRDAGRTGAALIVPVLLPDGDLDWAPYDQPRRRLGPGAVAGVDRLVVPALAVDLRGRRLGRGGGSYDRAMARSTAGAVACVYDDELVASLPTEPHDRPVSAVATPAGGVRARPV